MWGSQHAELTPTLFSPGIDSSAASAPVHAARRLVQQASIPALGVVSSQETVLESLADLESRAKKARRQTVQHYIDAGSSEDDLLEVPQSYPSSTLVVP